MNRLKVILLLVLSMIVTMLPVRAEETFAFSDIKGHWAEMFITESVKEGLFFGDADGRFNPDADITRAQFITVLWRMAGCPDAGTELPFLDTENQLPEFRKAISWGYENGYMKGISDTEFQPEATLTREEGIKIIHSYSGGNIGGEFQFYAIYEGLLKDSSEISDWAKSSVYWGIYNKLISGIAEMTISPKGTITRAQLARILVSYLYMN